jgi:hypothetical protein
MPEVEENMIVLDIVGVWFLAGLALWVVIMPNEEGR